MPKGQNATSRNEALVIRRVPITDLHEDQENARRHTKENVAAVRASLAEFGQQKPLVVDHMGKIVCGNATWVAARQLGWLEIDVVETNLVGALQRAYAISDNRTAELAEWNLDLLGQQIGDTPEVDWGAVGWSPGALDALLGTGNLGYSPGGVGGLDDAEAGISDSEEKDRAKIRERVKTISLTKDQRAEFENAAERIRESYADPDMTEGACVEHLAVFYLRDTESRDGDPDSRYNAAHETDAGLDDDQPVDEAL